jgi:hypothetical protein
MDCKILKSSNIVIDNIIIKKKVSVGNNIFNYPIKYLGDNLIIQTPILYIPFGIYKYGTKSYLDASFLNISVDKEMSEYKGVINSLNNKVVKFISNIYNIKSKGNWNFIDSVKQSTELYPDRMRFNLQADILIFSDTKKLLDFDYVKAKSYTKFLVTPVNIWLNDSKYGITWQILQIKIYPQTILNTYSFIDEDNSEPNINKYKSHPKYQKYFKMLSCGVPVDAVKHKMIVDNLDPLVLDDGKSSDVVNSANKINVQSSLTNILSKTQNKTNVNIMDEIKKNKKAKLEKVIKNSQVNTSIGFKPPSMQDILDMKSRLNKIK